MSETAQLNDERLHAKSPFELRVHLGQGLPDSDVRSALATGDMGFLHSFTTGATVDGPGVRVVAWTAGCQFRCLYCHNPDTWKMMNGIPVSVQQAADGLRKYKHGLKVMSGGFTLSGGEPLMQHKFALKLFAAGLGTVQRVDVLPFHQMGKYKWERLGIPYELAGTEPPDRALVDRVCEVFRAAGLKAV